MEKCRRLKRPQCTSKNWIYSWLCESPRKHASSSYRSESIARKALRWNWIFLWVDQRSKTTSHEKRDSDTLQHGELRFRSWFQACQRVHPPGLFLQSPWHLQDRGVINYPTSSSSSSSSPTTTASSDSETREREDRTESDASPVPVSSPNEEMIEQGDPLSAAESGKRSQAGQKNLKPLKEETTRERRDTRCLLLSQAVLKSGSGCKNSEKILWMKEFLNTETHTPVLLMSHL